MSCVYLVNVGANTSHRARARSPVFADGSFVYVSFPTKGSHLRGYAAEALPFLRGVDPNHTHADPCWDDLTYGDDCSNPRAAVLRRVVKSDILLFWGLLWKNGGRDWSAFSGERGWYLLGALRVEEIAVPGQSLQQVSDHNRTRASANPHFLQGGGVLPPNEHVFLGAPRYSSKFSRAIDLAVTNPVGLMYSAFTSSDGKVLVHDRQPSWRSSLRSCRGIWDLSDAGARARAFIVREAIMASTDFDLLEHL